jgi:hypothetical protein
MPDLTTVASPTATTPATTPAGPATMTTEL